MRHYSVVTAMLVIVTVFAAVRQSGLVNDNASAGNIAATAAVSVGNACSMTANTTSAHNATLMPGMYSVSYNDGSGTPYANGIGSTTLTTICNDNDGYAIYAVGYTGNTTTSGNTNLVGTTTGATIATGTNTSGDTSNWAMKLTKVTDTSVSYNPNNLTIESDTNGTYSNYHIVPSDYTKVASYSSTTDTTKGSKLTTTYAAYIGPSQAADTYVGQVKYVLVHPSTNDTNSFIINFNPNGGTGTMTPQKITIGQATTLTSNSFTAPANKVFNGWNTSPDGTGTSYTNGEQVTNLASAGTTITLYAQWKTPCAGYTTMQSLNSSNIDTFLPNIGDIATVCDIRDETKYMIGKLADDRVWMLENLALDLTDSDVKSAMLDSTDTKTNASHQTLNYLFNGGGSSPYTNIAVANANSSNYYDRPAIAKSGTCNNAYCVNNPTSGNWTYDSVTQTTINGKTSYAQGKIGIYYNFCAASAGSYCYTSGASVNRPNTAIDAAEDICPSGWRMPTGGAISTSGDNNGGGEFQNLYNKYNNAKLFQEALSTPLSGNFNSGKANDQGNSGVFWSSTRVDGYKMFNLYVYATGVYPQDMNYRYRSSGFSMRCIVGS